MFARRRSRPLAIALLGMIAATGPAACGGGDDDSSADADRQVIEDSMITVADLPDGFEVQDPASQADDDDDAGTDDCFAEVGADPDALDDAKAVEGDKVDFQHVTDDALIGITARITSFDDTDAPKANLQAVGNDDFLDCAVQSIERSSADGGQEVGDIDAKAIDSPVDVDDAAAIQLSFQTQGFPSLVELDLVLVGRYGISLQVLTVNAEIDEQLVHDVLQTMIDRIEDATG